VLGTHGHDVLAIRSKSLIKNKEYFYNKPSVYLIVQKVVNVTTIFNF
jgi:hypothetical protein